MEIVIDDVKFKTNKPLIIGVVGNYLSFLDDLSNYRNVGYIKKNEYYFTNYEKYNSQIGRNFIIGIC